MKILLNKRSHIFMIILLGIFLGSTLLYAQEISYSDSIFLNTRTKMYKAYDYFDEIKLLEVRETYDHLLLTSPNEWIIHYYSALVNNYLATYYHEYDNDEESEKCIDLGMGHIQQCIVLNQDFSDAYVVSSRLYGNQISINPIRGVALNQELQSTLNIAKVVEPDNPRIYLAFGSASMFTPKVTGGGLEKAKDQLAQAVKLFQSYRTKDPLYPDWGYEEAYAWLGQIAVKEDSLKLANDYYQKALEIKPDYPWVQYMLISELQNLEEEEQNSGNFLLKWWMELRSWFNGSQG